MAEKKCPKCGSDKYSTTLWGGVERVTTGLLSLGLAMVGEIHGHTAHHIFERTQHQVKCEKCGHTWHTCD